MNIKKGLLITLEFPPVLGGISTYLSELFRHFPHGTLKVLAPGEGEANYPHPIIRKNLYFKRIWPKWLAAFFRAARIVRQEQLGHVYISHILPMGYVALLLKIFYKTTYTVFLHGMDVRLAAAGKWKKFWLKIILRRALLVVANSAFTRGEVEKIISLAKLKIEVVNPPPKVYPPSEESSGHLREPIILSVARLVPRKGIDLGIEAFSKILNAVPNVKYYIVGDGPEAPRLKAQIDSLGLSSRVHMLGNVPDVTLSELYSRASVFLFPVRDLPGDAEGFGIASLEASAHGTPVIASNTGGVGESVQDGLTGILIPPGNVRAIEETVIFILKNPHIAKEMGEAGRKWAERFRPEAQVEKLMSLILLNTNQYQSPNFHPQSR